MLSLILLLIFCLHNIDSLYIQKYCKNDHSNFYLRMAGGPIRGDLIPNLVSLASSSKLGLMKDNNNEIITLMEQIADSNERFIKSDKNLMNKITGNWQLLWTTEKVFTNFDNKILLKLLNKRHYLILISIQGNSIFCREWFIW